jgi:hypothetical protein
MAKVPFQQQHELPEERRRPQQLRIVRGGGHQRAAQRVHGDKGDAFADA